MNDTDLIRVEHLEYLKAVKKNTLATIETVSSVEVDGKTYLVYHDRVVTLNCDYLKLENKRRFKEGLEPLSKAGSLPWGKWVVNGVLIEHKGQFYLRYYPYDGDLQCAYKYYRNDDGSQAPLPPFDGGLQSKVFAAYSERHKGKPSVCHNVNVMNITELSLLDKEGEPDVDVIYIKHENEPDFNT